LRSNRYLRLLLVAAAIIFCLLVIRSSATFGLSRLLATYSLSAGSLPAANTAAEVAPRDAEAHFAKAAIVSMSGDSQQSLNEVAQAVALRPADYTLWQQLGLVRDQLGDTIGSLAAFDEAIKRAPFYSQPRWNRGNVLLRAGHYEAAFNDLSEAAQSNPDLIPNLLDLAWGVSRGNVELTEELAQIKSEKMRLAFAAYLARRGKGKEAVAQFARAGKVPDAIKRELVDQLLSKGAFSDAFVIWKASHESEAGRELVQPSIYDGGFEGTLEIAGGGFAWRVPHDLQAATIALDSVQPHSGARCLRVEFGGNSNPGLLLISQLILVEPSRRYKVNFAARSQDIVTGGLPLVTASDAAGAQKRLGQSPPLAQGDSDWQLFSFEFTAGPTTSGVFIGLQRDCMSSPCPIFGSVSVDSFSVEELQ
jgi:tetratricopeptide (TPR) repeat protein